MRRLGKKAVTTKVLIGLIILVPAILFLYYTSTQIQTSLIEMITFKNKLTIYEYASKPNFNRLNDEIDVIFDKEENYFYKIIPYTLGEDYVLIGFNKKIDANDCIKGDVYVKPDSCRNKACLCLCHKNAGCEDNCVGYRKIDYFLSAKNSLNTPYNGGEFEDITDPLTGDSAYCLQIDGTKGLINWHSKNIYLEKFNSYVYIAAASSKTEERIEIGSGNALPGGSINMQFSCEGVQEPTLHWEDLVDVYNSQGFNTYSYTLRQFTEIYAQNYELDPALLAAFETLESGMNTQSNCPSLAHKTALTGCGWDDDCSVNCGCENEFVFSDQKQIICTANFLKQGFELADESALGCEKYSSADDHLNFWKCLFCAYKTGEQTDDTVCGGYADQIIEYYCDWSEYYASISP